MMSPEHKRALFLLEKLAEQEYDRFFADPNSMNKEELEYVLEALKLVGSPRGHSIVCKLETLILEQC